MELYENALLVGCGFEIFIKVGVLYRYNIIYFFIWYDYKVINLIYNLKIMIQFVILYMHMNLIIRIKIVIIDEVIFKWILVK